MRKHDRAGMDEMKKQVKLLEIWERFSISEILSL